MSKIELKDNIRIIEQMEVMSEEQIEILTKRLKSNAKIIILGSKKNQIENSIVDKYKNEIKIVKGK